MNKNDDTILKETEETESNSAEAEEPAETESNSAEANVTTGEKEKQAVGEEDVKLDPIEEDLTEAVADVDIENKASEWEDKYKRALADYQNLEKRVAQQRRELIISASRDVIQRMLPVLDTLQLAAQHIDDKGLAVSIQQFLDVLKAEGVERIETNGIKFDPLLMEAVGTQDGKDGLVLEEARAGYIMNERLLRPAQVIVGKKN